MYFLDGGNWMREIKFRAWNKGQNCLMPWDQLMDVRYNERWFLDNMDKNYINCIFTDSEYILMQYTGLKDKNGVEVYEGDILESITIEGYNYPAAEVVFDEGAFSVKFGSDNYCPCLYTIPINDLIVIGNIHEKP